MPLECHWLTQCTLGYHWATQLILTGYTRTPLEKLSWNSPHSNATEETLTFAAYAGTRLEGLWQPAQAPTHIVKHAQQHPCQFEMTRWRDTSKQWSGLCIFSIYLEFTALQWIPVLLLTHVSTSTSPCACLWYEHHYSFCVLGLQVKWNQLSSDNSLHTSCIHKGSHAGKWSDIMTSKPDSVSTLGYIGQTTLDDHWSHKYTGMPLEPHWLMLAPSGVPVAIQC